MKIILLLLSLCAFKHITPTDELEKIRELLRHLNSTGLINIPWNHYDEPPIRDEPEEYDVIVVGAGSAGSILTNRLSKISEWKILLLEAGGVPDILADVPAFSGLMPFTNHNWNYFTQKESNAALGLNDKRVHWPRGKGLGGTSLLNFVVHSRGHPKDYDLWGAMGNDGWSYKDVLPYLKRMENAKQVKHQDEGYRGNDGDLHAEDLHFRHTCADVFLNAAKENGHEEIDYNGKTPTGVSFSQLTTRNGLRCSGERCLLRPVKERKNLTIRLNSHVTKVLIDSSSKKAYGVEFIKDGKKYVALAKKEVILCGGTVNSAQTLMLSGVGPKEDLERVGIDVVKDLPVGKKVLDHVFFFGLGFTTEEPLFCYDRSKITDPQEYVKLFKGEKSYLHISGFETQLFFKSNVSNEVDYPDVEIGLLSPFIGSDNGLFKKILNLRDDIYQQYLKASSDTVFGLIPIIMHPKSHGRIELQSSHPFDYPNIYGGYFTDAEGQDMRTMIAGIIETLKIMDHREFRDHGVKLMDLQLPVCKDHKFGSEPYWRCAVQQLSTTTFHPVNSCKMGPSHDPEAVVDSRLRVYGIQNLRVADASVIPVTITGHTNLPSYLVGEKAAELIAEDWIHRQSEL